jgi:hypothetical protein
MTGCYHCYWLLCIDVLLHSYVLMVWDLNSLRACHGLHISCCVPCDVFVNVVKTFCQQTPFISTLVSFYSQYVICYQHDLPLGELEERDTPVQGYRGWNGADTGCPVSLAHGENFLFTNVVYSPVSCPRYSCGAPTRQSPFPDSSNRASFASTCSGHTGKLGDGSQPRAEVGTSVGASVKHHMQQNRYKYTEK